MVRGDCDRVCECDDAMVVREEREMGYDINCIQFLKYLISEESRNAGN